MSGLRRPTLVAGVKLVEQIFQGQPGYVVKRPDTGAYVRFRPTEAQVMQCFTGERTINQVVSLLATQGVPVGASTIDAFATRLAELGIVERTLTERSTAQLERLRLERRERRRKPLFRGELLRMRFSLGDPDALLTRTMPWVRWCFTPAFVWGSVVVFILYAALLIARWPELQASFTQLTTPANWTLATGLFFWGSFILVGVVHEFGHAYACKGFNGGVNEMGFMIMYFQPAFYCNVNDAWTFPRLSDRLWVTAAGAWVELLFGAAAAFTWAVAAPGTVLSDVSLMITVLAGGMALLSNVNPLLPYDGYFALTDWLEIPNLRQRAIAYFNWYVSAHILRRPSEEPAASEREQRVFMWYGGLATLYTFVVYFVVLRFVIGWTARTFGVPAAAVLTGTFVVWQRHRLIAWWGALREGWRDFVRAKVQPRLRALPAPLRGGRGLSLLALLLLLLPWPRNVDGFWNARPLGYTVVTAPIDGVVTAVNITGGAPVLAGTPLVQLRNGEVSRAVTLAALDRDSLQLRTTEAAALRTSMFAPSQAAGVAASVRLVAEEARQRGLTVRATGDGNVLTERPSLLVGKAVRAGTPLLHIGRLDSLELRLHFRGAGATAITQGQRARLLLDTDLASPRTATLQHVSLLSSPDHPGETAALLWIPADSAWRAGTTGRVRVRLGWSTVGGALLWTVRSRVRADLFL
jgi:putative peptide zinc metalloprotease protein